jgi:uncharacterized protein YoxC
MKHSFIFIPALIIISAVMLNYVPYSTAQPSDNKEAITGQIDNTSRLRELMNELQNTVTTLRETRQGYYSRKQEKDEEVQELRMQIQSLKETHEDLVSEVEDIEKEMDNLNSEGERFKSSISSFQSKEDELSNSILSYVKLLREQVNDGIPFRLEEKTAKLDAISNGINATTPMDIAEACNQLWSFCKEELRMAVTSEVYLDSIRLADGREPHEEFVRVGKIVLAFTTEDGKDAGVWLKQNGNGSEGAPTGWVKDSSSVPSHTIEKAIKIYKRQQPQEMINFPISFSQVRLNQRYE